MRRVQVDADSYKSEGEVGMLNGDWLEVYRRGIRSLPLLGKNVALQL